MVLVDGGLVDGGLVDGGLVDGGLGLGNGGLGVGNGGLGNGGLGNGGLENGVFGLGDCLRQGRWARLVHLLMESLPPFNTDFTHVGTCSII